MKPSSLNGSGPVACAQAPGQAGVGVGLGHFTGLLWLLGPGGRPHSPCCGPGTAAGPSQPAPFPAVPSSPPTTTRFFLSVSPSPFPEPTTGWATSRERTRRQWDRLQAQGTPSLTGETGNADAAGYTQTPRARPPKPGEASRGADVQRTDTSRTSRNPAGVECLCFLLKTVSSPTPVVSMTQSATLP